MSTLFQSITSRLTALKASLLSAANGSGADLIGGGGRIVTSLTALRALSKTGAGKATLIGNTAAGDGADRTYFYDAADVASADNGLSIILAGDGGRWKLGAGDPGPVLTATEGVPYANGYLSAHAGAMIVPAAPGEVRYWTANYTLSIPAGVALTSGDVKQDMLSVSGHSRSQSVNSRIWGVAGLAQQDAACATNAQVGQCYGGEFDVNNNSGLDMTNFAADGDVCAVMAATGGANVAKMAYCVSAVGTSKFYAGMWMRQGSLHASGFAFYIDNVAPAHGLYFSDAYTGGDAVSAPAGKAYVCRMTAGPNGTIQSVGTALQFNCGNGGYAWANGANTTTLATLTNAGAFSPLVHCMGIGAAWPVKTANAAAIDVSTGGLWGLADTVATNLSAFNNGAPNQRITLRATTANTTIVRSASILCSGGANIVLPVGGTVSFINNNGVWIQDGAMVAAS